LGSNPGLWLITVVTLLFSIAIHEWAHAVSADYLGDDTPRRQGRVTLWPLVHWDPIGTLFMLISTWTGFGLGWGRPVMTNPANYTRTSPRVGDSLVAFAGPLSNILIAAVFGTLLRFGVLDFDHFFMIWGRIIVLVNVGLFCFNLLPIYPLDGSHIFLNALPGPAGENLRRFMQQFGIFIFLALVMSRALGPILNPLRFYLYGLLTGTPI